MATLFDFRAPLPLSAADRDTFAGLGARVVPLLRSLFAARLRLTCQAAMAEPQPFTMSGYVDRAGAGSAVWCRFRDAGSPALQFAPEFARFLIDRLLGGEGAPADTSIPLTDIERAVLMEFCQRLGARIVEAAGTLCPLTMEQPVISASAPAVVAPGGRVVLLSFRITWESGNTDLHLWIPRTTKIADDSATAAEMAEWVDREVRTMRVPVAARMDLRLPAHQVAAFAEGFVVDTGRPSHAEIEIQISGAPWFQGVLGRDQGHVGVRVVRAIPRDTQPQSSVKRAS